MSDSENIPDRIARHCIARGVLLDPALVHVVVCRERRPSGAGQPRAAKDNLSCCCG